MAVSFSIHESEKLHAFISKGVEEAVHRGLISTANKVVRDIVSTIIPGEPNPPVDRGIYRARWQVDENDPVSIFNDAPYASIIEKGARPENIKIGPDMIQALTEWVLRKGLAGARVKNPTARAQQEVQARNIAWAIAVSMKTKGIFNNGKGLNIGEKAKALVGKYVNEEIAREMQRMK